jgi:hypothetical protein
MTALQPELDFSGSTYVAARDKVRLNRQASAVWNLMRDGQWRTLREIHEITKGSEASVSARLRDFRKPIFGSHIVERLYIRDGLHAYRVIVNEAVDMDTTDH